MSFRSSLLAALSALAVSSTAVWAGPITVTSYDMNNGNGTVSLGSYNYLDGAYVGTSPAANSVTEGAPLTGGTGILTNGIIPTVDYTQAPTQYVGWKYTDPTLNFHLQAGSQVNQISLYFANPVQVPGSLVGGLVGVPGQVTLTINGVTVAITPTFSAFSPLTEVVTFNFDSPLNYTDDTTFGLTIDRGPLLDDALYYNSLYPGDTVFNENAIATGKEPWFMLSEVQFLTAVPEPSTWIMMIAGFAGLGIAAYRRKAKLAPAVA
jgi:PEP-CTERM motif-containing protein